MPNVLIVANTPSKNTQLLTQAVVKGASHPDLSSVEIKVFEPFDANADHVLWADGIILGTTENFGYMSGALKDFFERIYYPCLEKTQGMPYQLFVKAGLDGTGARISVEKIIIGLRWKAINKPYVMTGKFTKKWIEPCEELGLYMSAGLENGIF